MKRTLIFGLGLTLLLPLLIAGCVSEKSASPTKEASPTATPEFQTVKISLDEFEAQKSRSAFVETTYPGTVTFRLGSNPTTGYSWEVKEIVHPEVIAQVSNDYEEPADTGLVGAGGTDVWVFNARDTGLAIIRMSYGQSGAGGEKDVYTVTVNVNVR